MGNKSKLEILQEEFDYWEGQFEVEQYFKVKREIEKLKLSLNLNNTKGDENA